eukprot:2426373-Pyramimonas_sp.AAC.1
MDTSGDWNAGGFQGQGQGPQPPAPTMAAPAPRPVMQPPPAPAPPAAACQQHKGAGKAAVPLVPLPPQPGYARFTDTSQEFARIDQQMAQLMSMMQNVISKTAEQDTAIVTMGE